MLINGVTNLISQPLTMIFNSSLRKGIFPNTWKVAKVTPIFKSGSRSSGEARMKKLVLPFWNERKTLKRGSQNFLNPAVLKHSMESTHFQILKVDIHLLQV